MKTALRILIVTLFVAVVTFGIYYYFKINVSQQEVDQYQSFIKEGDNALSINEYADALTKYSSAADLIPSKVDAYSHILDILIMKNQLGMAEDILNKSSLNVSKGDKYILELKIGQAFLKVNDYDKAKKYLVLASEVRNSDETKIGLAIIDIHNNNFDNAQKVLSVINDSNYNNFAKAKLLLSYLKFDNTTDAKTVLADVDVSRIDDVNQLRLQSTTSSTMVSGIEIFRKQLDKGGEDSLYNSAIVSQEYINQGFPNLAIKVLEPKLDKMGEYFDGLYFLSRAYYDSGKYQSSLEVAQTAASISNSYSAYLMIARDYYATQDYDNSFTYYSKALLVAPDSNKVLIYDEYIRLLAINNRDAEIEKQLNAAYKKFNSSWVELLYTDLYYNQKNYTKMSTYLSKLSKRSDLNDMDKKNYYKYKILYSIENGKLTNAREDLNLLKSLDRYNPEYYWLNGWVALIEKNTTEARNSLNKSINYDISGSVTESAKKLLARID